MSSKKHFGEFVPLLIFTALLIIAAGIVIGVAAAYVILPVWWELDLSLLAIALVLVVFGGLISFLHLGRKGRAGRAALGLSHSWLSREAVLAGFFTVSTMAAFFARVFIRSEGIYSTILIIAALFGLLTTVAVGKLYDLSAQAGWRGWAQVLAPPVSALLLGLALFCSAPGGEGYKLFFYTIWLADVALLGWRDGMYGRNIREGAAFSFPGLSRFTQLVYNVRKLLSIVTIVAFGMSGGLAAAGVIAIAICLDRFCLYAASAQITPTNEVAALKAERMEQATG